MDLPKPENISIPKSPPINPDGSDLISNRIIDNSELKQDLKQNRPVLMLAGGIALMILGIALGALITSKLSSPNHISGPVTVTPTPKTINVSDFDPIATTSAFLDLQMAQASLSSSLSSFNSDDQTVSPPVLDLSLDFQR